MIRFIVLPLALQREQRRDLNAPILAVLPVEVEGWILSRNSHRHFPADLWPQAPGFAPERARKMGLPLEEIEDATGLRLFRTGEWLFARGAESDWWLLGPLPQLLKKAPEAAVIEENGEMWEKGDFHVVARGAHFLLSGSEGALARAQGGWLMSLPEWTELGDLLMAGDLLLYRREDASAALGAVRVLDGMILAEGLAWGGTGTRSLIEWVDPLPDVEGSAGIGSAKLPSLLRSSPPWDVQGDPLVELETKIGPDGAALRLWGKGDLSAYSHVIVPRR